MHRRGTPEGEQAPKRGEAYDRKAYKRSVYAEVIDSVLRMVVSEGLANKGKLSSDTQKLADWTSWMIRGGFRKSDEEIGKKTEELVGLSEEEHRAMVGRWTGKE